MAIGFWAVSDSRADPDLVPAKAAGAGLTFNRDIAPIIFQHCTVCHREGEAGPFPLVSYGDVSKRGRQIAEATARRFMPPWLPANDCGPYVGERRLSEKQIRLIAEWVNQGAPEGRAEDLPPLPKFPSGWGLGEPDLVVKMPEAYTLPADGKDVYRNFVLPVPDAADRYVKAVELHPGDPRFVHHAFLFIDRSREARRLDGRDEAVGFEGMSAGDGAQAPEGQFLSWQPGKRPQRADESWLLRRGSDLVLQMHMRPSGKPERLQASVGLYFTDKPPGRPTYRLLLRSTQIDIPAGEKKYTIEDQYTLPVTVEVLAVLPHAHYLGKDLRGMATLPDGKQITLMHIPNWDFNWQGDYRFVKPISLPAGTKLWMRYSYDNSAENPLNPASPPARMGFGPNTTDEMGELWLLVRPKDARALRELADHNIRNWGVRDNARMYSARLRRDPNDAEAHIKLGNTYGAVRRFTEAESHLRAALKIDPNNSNAHFNLGKVLQARSRADEAKREFELAIEADPDNFRAQNELGVMLLGKGQFDKAEKLFRRALKTNEHEAKTWINLGVVAAGRGNKPEAIRCFERALEADPDDAAARGNLSKLKSR